MINSMIESSIEAEAEIKKKHCAYIAFIILFKILH